MSVITIFIAISIPTPKLTLEKVKVLTSAPIPGRKNQTDNISAVAKDRISPIKPKHK
jgi:hypothetical protein